MSKLSRMGHALYSGQVSIDFVGRKLWWYALSAVILALAAVLLGLAAVILGRNGRGGARAG